MNENLLGYLLGALEPDERAALEQELQRDPGLRHHLDLLRRAVAPLAADAEPPPVPDRLADRTLAFVARRAVEPLGPPNHVPPGPEAAAPSIRRRPPVTRPSFASGGWRRVDLLVAAALLLAVLSLALPARNALMTRAAILGCQDTLRRYHQALSHYGDSHNGEFPVARPEHPRHNFAGVFVPALQEEGLIDPLGRPDCGSAPTGIPSLRDFDAMTAEDFERSVERASGRYAYTLGYRDGSTVRPLHREHAGMNLPIMADIPPRPAPGGGSGVGPGNSPNHGGAGQNVLFVDGHVEFVPGRNVGPDGDDIYTNQQNQVGAGLHVRDTVLGESKARP